MCLFSFWCLTFNGVWGETTGDLKYLPSIPTGCFVGQPGSPALFCQSEHVHLKSSEMGLYVNNGRMGKTRMFVYDNHFPSNFDIFVQWVPIFDSSCIIRTSLTSPHDTHRTSRRGLWHVVGKSKGGPDHFSPHHILLVRDNFFCGRCNVTDIAATRY